MNFKYFIDGVRDSLESQCRVFSLPTDVRILIKCGLGQVTGSRRNPHRNISEGPPVSYYICESRSRAEHVNDLGDKQTVDYRLLFGGGRRDGQSLSHCLESPGKIREKEFAALLSRLRLFRHFNLFCSFVTRAKTQISVRFMQLRK